MIEYHVLPRGVVLEAPHQKDKDEEVLPGYDRFFKHFNLLELTLLKTKQSTKLESKRNSLRAQITAGGSFQKFIQKNLKAVKELMSSNLVKSNLKQAEGIFDQNVANAQRTLNDFRNKSLEIVMRNRDKKELKTLRIKILSEGRRDIAIYRRKRETLFLAGLYSVYQNALKTTRNVRFRHIKPPTSLEMVKTVGGSMKRMTDSLIPSFVDLLHQKVVRHSGLSSQFDSNYRSRTYLKSQSAYLDQYLKLNPP